MRAVEYRSNGGPEVLNVLERDVPEPGPGEVLVKVAFSGINPTDWKARQGTPPPNGVQVPHQDGSGVVEGAGHGVDPAIVGRRVWLWESAYRRMWGTAAEYTVVPVHKAAPLGADVSFELGAALGIPFLTAHRCLTIAEWAPVRLGPGTLQDRVVLVQGGAGAVGNAAIQLARWADATVIATVSSAAKAQLAVAAGADHVVNYRQQDVVAEVRKLAPSGVDAIVEVSAKTNGAIDAQLLAPLGAVAMYGGEGSDLLQIGVRGQMVLNSRWQFVLVYGVSERVKNAAVQDVSDAAASGALRVGDEAGLPLSVYPLAETARAQQAVADGAVGKVLIDVRR